MSVHGRAGVACTLVATAVVLAWSGARGQSLYEPPVQKYLGARGMALGDAIGSDEFDIESMYRNPATLAYLRHANVVADQRHDYAGGVFSENIAGRVFASRTMAVGLGAGMESAGKFTTAGPYKFTQYDLDAAWAFRVPSVSSDLSLGLLGNFRLAQDDSLSRRAAQFAAGLMYSPTPGTSYSVIYRGLGTGVDYTAEEAGTAQVTRGGIRHPPRSLEIGSTMRYPSTSAIPFLTISISGEKDFATRLVRLRGGAEVVIADVLSLRLGYLNAEVWQVRYGIGLSIAGVTFDYAIMPLVGAGKFDEMTLKIGI